MEQGEKLYIIRFIYESGRRQLLLDEEYMHLRSLEQVEAYAAQKMKKLNLDFVSSIVGHISGYEIFEGRNITGGRYAH